MTWRDHTWEFVITAFSWLVAFMALGAVIGFVIFDAYKNRRGRR